MGKFVSSILNTTTAGRVAGATRLDLPEDRSRLVPIARTETAKDVLFIRSVQVPTKNEIPSCTEVINEELVEKAQELFAQKD